MNEEQIEKMGVFHKNEISPRLKKNNINPIQNWEQYKEAVIFGKDMFLLREKGILNTVQIRQYLDQYIGKLHK